MWGREWLSPSLPPSIKFFTMEQTPKRGGRPPKKAATPSKTKFKRTLKDESNLPRTYEVINGCNYILRISSKNVQVFDKESNRVRAIRYAPLENSVFMDEQSSLARVEHVMFENKYLVVPVEKPNLIQFMELHPDNVANGGTVFKLVNKEENFEEDVEMDFKISDAISIIKSRPIDELLPVALALKVDTNQKDLAIKHGLIRFAKQKPDEFLATLNSPMVNARSVVSQCLDFQVIEQRNGAVVWFDTGKMIVSVPVGQDAVEVMTRFVMTDKGSTVLSELERQLEAIA